jgi:hypothetical protein
MTVFVDETMATYNEINSISTEQENVCCQVMVDFIHNVALLYHEIERYL